MDKVKEYFKILDKMKLKEKQKDRLYDELSALDEKRCHLQDEILKGIADDKIKLS